MKVHGINGGYLPMRETNMPRERSRENKRSGDSVELSPESLRKRLEATKDSSASASSGTETRPLERGVSVSEATPATRGSASPVRHSKLEHARQMIASGGYDSPEILDVIVERLVTALRG